MGQSEEGILVNDRTTVRATRPPITRRSAIQAGALSALGVGLMAAATGTTHAEPAPQTVVVNTDDLADECRARYTEYRAASNTHNQLYDALRSLLSPDQRRLLSEYSDRGTENTVAFNDWMLAEVARHLPGMAPAIRMIAEHANTVAYRKPGACCTVAEGFEA